MNQNPSLRQRIAVVDPTPRTREHARRAIRGLGHTPVVFTSVSELLMLGKAHHRYALMCFGVGPNEDDVRALVELGRAVLGSDIPVMFITSGGSARALKELGRVRPNETLITPSSFADVYNAMEGFMIRNGLPLADDGLVWGPYRFYPACALANVSGTEVWLDSPEFELALEFFHNINRPLSSTWLRGMVPKIPARSWARWLDSRVDQLRRELDLGPLQPPEPPGAHWDSYRLASVSHNPQATAGFAIERCLQS
ncbi:MAG: hypothetical protein KKC79_03215 [Gammaproteobacteria bacterium]|nr:hypothetical protein [Gammaproteobacteria bacterium]MBU1443184.1 hypothetical protein [Gammaproteobacteria bacterium]MBU2286830.1 hypothetical protein [Gammaproteobacteria bacterium]MBU2407640.1 hypothetical protein [Gammaproteobacteria bacterium]